MKQLTFNTSLIILSLVLLLSCKKNTEDLKNQSVKEDEIFNFVEQMPEFPDGPKLTKATVTRGIGYGCDEEAVRVIQSMPYWKPGKYKNKEVPVNFTLPVKFKL